jgi:integrase
MVEINRSQGVKKLSYTKPLHEVISSHMARRTAVSILLNVYRLPVNQVMEITGHSDYKTLRRYIDKDRESLRTNLEQTRSVSEIMTVVKSA